MVALYESIHRQISALARVGHAYDTLSGQQPLGAVADITVATRLSQPLLQGLPDIPRSDDILAWTQALREVVDDPRHVSAFRVDVYGKLDQALDGYSDDSDDSATVTTSRLGRLLCLYASCLYSILSGCFARQVWLLEAKRWIKKHKLVDGLGPAGYNRLQWELLIDLLDWYGKHSLCLVDVLALVVQKDATVAGVLRLWRDMDICLDIIPDTIVTRLWEPSASSRKHELLDRLGIIKIVEEFDHRQHLTDVVARQQSLLAHVERGVADTIAFLDTCT